MKNFVNRFSIFCLAVGATFVLGCSAPPAEKDPVEGDLSELSSLDPKSDAFSTRLKLLGTLAYGETSTTVKYKNPPRYRGYRFVGNAGDAVTAAVRSANGGDAVAWIVNARFDVLGYNDDSPGSLDSIVEATLPANLDSNDHSYYVIFREYSLKTKSFTVELTGPSTCDYAGTTYRQGDTFPSTDGCNTCFCGEGGAVGCTKRACVTTCDYEGTIYQKGESFPASDGCNTCYCGDTGVVGCTKIACPVCDPSSEPNRQYVGNSLEQCQLIRFTCVAGATYFSSACGCGCEQPADCPAWINCMPGPQPSTCAAETARCPLSQIAW